jgi:hypothetical protein
MICWLVNFGFCILCGGPQFGRSFGREHHTMTALQWTTRRIGNQLHTGERPKNPTAAWAGYLELRAVIGPENLATGDGPQGVEVIAS